MQPAATKIRTSARPDERAFSFTRGQHNSVAKAVQQRVERAAGWHSASGLCFGRRAQNRGRAAAVSIPGDRESSTPADAIRRDAGLDERDVRSTRTDVACAREVGNLNKTMLRLWPALLHSGVRLKPSGAETVP